MNDNKIICDDCHERKQHLTECPQMPKLKGGNESHAATFKPTYFTGIVHIPLDQADMVKTIYEGIRPQPDEPTIQQEHGLNCWCSECEEADNSKHGIEDPYDTAMEKQWSKEDAERG